MLMPDQQRPASYYVKSKLVEYELADPNLSNHNELNRQTRRIDELAESQRSKSQLIEPNL